MRRPRFSLLSLLLFTLLVGSGVALWMHWPAWRVESRVLSPGLVTVSGDGRWFWAYGGFDDPTALFDSSGKLLKEFDSAEQGDFTFIRLSEDSNFVDFWQMPPHGNRKRAKRSWNIERAEWVEQPTKRMTEKKYETLSPDGRWILVRTDLNVLWPTKTMLYDALTGVRHLWWDFRTRSDQRVEFLSSANGKSVLLLNENDRCDVLELPSLKIMASYPYRMTYPKLSPSHRWIADFKLIEYAIVIRDAVTGRVQLEIPCAEYGFAFRGDYEFSPDEKQVCLTDDGSKRGELWDIETRQKVDLEYPGSHPEIFFSQVEFTRDGKRLSTKEHSFAHNGAIWDRFSGKCLYMDACNFISPNAKYVIKNNALLKPPSTDVLAEFSGYYEYNFMGDTDRILAAYNNTEAGKLPYDILVRYRPEEWWGVAWLPEFWSTVVLAGLFGWNILRNRRGAAG